MLYRQITFAERYTLGLLRQRGLSPAAIARILGRHRSTVGREVRRNRAHSDGTYRPPLADWYARGRRSRSRRNRRFTVAEWARGRLAGKRPISTRPAAADARTQVGHWEADTVLGAGQAGACVLSLVERKTGYLVLGKLRQRTSAEVNRRAQPLIHMQPHPVRTITVDNGTEFHEYAARRRARVNVRIRSRRPPDQLGLHPPPLPAIQRVAVPPRRNLPAEPRRAATRPAVTPALPPPNEATAGKRPPHPLGHNALL